MGKQPQMFAAFAVRAERGGLPSQAGGGGGRLCRRHRAAGADRRRRRGAGQEARRRRRSPRSAGMRPARCWPGAPRAGEAGVIVQYSPERRRLSAPARCVNCQGSLAVDLLRKQARPSGERRPVGVFAEHRAEIGQLDFQAAAEVHLVGLDDAAVRVLQHPDHAGQHRRGHLQAGGVLVGREPRVSSIESCEPYQ